MTPKSSTVALRATFEHAGKKYTAVGRYELVENRRCAHAPSGSIHVGHVESASGFVSEPVEGGGLYRAAFEALAQSRT